jgi:hypothetical protein
MVDAPMTKFFEPKLDLKLATKREPLFGWNCPADLLRAEEYLETVRKTDSDFVYGGDHIAKLRAFGIHPARAYRLITNAWPLAGTISEREPAKLKIRILRHYVDANDDPGANASGDSYREENSDGSWDEKFSKTKLRVFKEWQWIVAGMQFVNDDGLRFLNDKQFERLFGKYSKKNLMSAIDRGEVPMKKFIRQVYIPNSPKVMKHDGQTVFNIWRPSGLKPKPGDHQWFLDHVAFMVPDKIAQGYLLDYMAHLIQHPETKIHFALLIQSIEGAGKGALAHVLRRIIGNRNCGIPSNDDVISKYTGWQEGIQLAVINELMAEGRADVLNRLKAPITEDTLRIEKKYGNAFTIPNHMNLFCMTNFKDALPIREGDRRWLVIFSPALKRPTKYYAELFANVADDSKVAAVAHYLKNRAIALDPKAPAPYTEAKREMQERARSDISADLHGDFENRQGAFQHPLVRIEDITQWLRADRKSEKGLQREAFAFLDSIKALKLRRYRSRATDLPPFQIYAVRDQEEWASRAPIDVARAYQAQCMADEDEDQGERPAWDS